MRLEYPPPPLAPVSPQIGELRPLLQNYERATNGPPPFSSVSPSQSQLSLASAFTPNRSPATSSSYVIISITSSPTSSLFLSPSFSMTPLAYPVDDFRSLSDVNNAYILSVTRDLYLPLASSTSLS